MIKATPATTGGSTSGTITAARTTERPGNSIRANSQASGVPSSTQAMTVATEASAVSQSACSTEVEVTWLTKSPHGVCTIKLTVGTTSRAAASTAGTSRTAGVRPREP